MNNVVKVLLTILLVLLLLFCTLALFGAASLDEGETVDTGKLILVIIGELVAIAGLWSLWRGRRAGAV